MKILLLGANGQLGQAFRELATTSAFPLGWSLTAWSSVECDLSRHELLLSLLELLKPDVILNAAAYTAVDLAEKEQALCDSINICAPAILARFCRDHDVPLIHYSSDYVYGGAGVDAWTETEPLSPQNYYGRSKARGDEAIENSGCEHLIFRTSWVFSTVGRNFVNTMLKLRAERNELKVVEDQVGAPTYAPDLAEYSLQALMRALEMKAEGRSFPSGVYHLTNSGFTSWADFARAILPNDHIVGISSSDYPTTAVRPLNSRLNLNKFTTTFGVYPRSWQEALAICLEKLKNQN